ncbi:MAG: shikimate dehydrogenase [Rhodanobacteraceae bacterium]|nr:shikimate dehydrogenase [Rhodanobacteraceae bacterium]
MDSYVLFGHPVAHSRSPWIHAQFAAQFGYEQSYECVDVVPEHFEETLWNFAEAGGRGANVTLPLKEQAAMLCDELTPAAARAGAANTLIRLPGQRWRGDNTDGAGLLVDFERLGIAVSGRRLVIIGAGGATRGILGPLLELAPRQIVIVNRTPERALQLVLESGAMGVVQAWSLDDLASVGHADVLIHATSAYRAEGLPPLPEELIDAETVAYDLGYGPSAEVFLAQARRGGAHLAVDGLGMLVEQAAESFLRWRGVRPQTAVVRENLRRLLADG